MHSDGTYLQKSNVHGVCRFEATFLVCPNPTCKKVTVSASLQQGRFEQTQHSSKWQAGKTLHSWGLLPKSKAQTFPKFVPQAIIDDYEEACLIKDLSPKASATLSRRCLQGIIRDFWKVKPGRLVDEIAAIQSKIDPLTWDAIEAVRKVGNIGAHMEKDIDVIVDVEPKEAELLVGLIEMLVKDWYVANENRKTQLNALIAVAEQKEKEKKQPASAAS